jgi:hypothetical protein
MLAVTIEKQSNLVGHNLKEQENSYSKNEQASLREGKKHATEVLDRGAARETHNSDPLRVQVNPCA